MKIAQERRELRQLGVEELVTELEGGRRELFNLRLRAATRQLAQHHELRRARKKIARLMTFLAEKQRRLASEKGLP